MIDYSSLLLTLEKRFYANMNRHKNMLWQDVCVKLLANASKLEIIRKMEETSGEPDVVFFDHERNEYVFFDCSAETPSGRLNLCYDQKALETRKKFKPLNSATFMAESIGVELLSEEDYLFLQTLGDFDLKTSSWIKTPDNVRLLGGALFGDKRYNRTFIYHNGAESYYSVRGFRGFVKI